jgi:hypothetical protein
MPELGFPPAEMIDLIVNSGRALVGEYIIAVALKQVADSVSLGFRGREVTTLDDGTFHHLRPFFGVRKFRK